MIYIQVSDSETAVEVSKEINEAILKNAARETLNFTRTSPDADLTVVLSEDTQLHSLNLEYLEVDAPTDVLAFQSNDVDPDSGMRYLGDVIISLERARTQAIAAGHSLDNELRLLIVHGVLHLLGYDHGTEQDKVAMWAAQEQILAQLRKKSDLST